MKPSTGLLLAALTCTSGCTLYQPVLPATPALRQKGETELYAGYRTPFGADACAAYSPASHWQVAATYNLRNDWGPWNESKPSSYRLRNQQYELSTGYYTAIAQNRWHLGTLAGFGQGWATSVHDPQGFDLIAVVPVAPGGGGSATAPLPELRREGRYNKWFVQVYGLSEPSAAGRLQMQSGFSLRFAYAQFRAAIVDEVATNLPGSLLLEPAWNLRLGSASVQGQVGVGLVVCPETLPEANVRLLPQSALQLSVGVVANPTRIFRKKQ